MTSSALASGPTSTRALFLRTASRMIVGRLLGRGHGELLVEEVRQRRRVEPLGGRRVAHDGRLDAAGVHGGDLDGMTVRDHLLTQRLGEPANGELGRVVGGLTRDGEDAEKAGDVDDVAVAGLDEVREERLRAVDDAPEVDVHHAFDVLERGDLDVADVGDARIVVDLVDLAEVGLDLVGVEQERFALGDVEAVGLRRAPMAARRSSVTARPSASTSLIATLAPDRPSSRASAWPMPEPAPVTTQTFPAKPSMDTPSCGYSNRVEFRQYRRYRCTGG